MILDKDIKEILLPNDALVARIKELGKEISSYYKGQEIIICGVLTGSLNFMAELMKYIDLDVRVDFIKASSYEGENSTGTVRIIHDMIFNPKGKNVLLVEDIVDTGLTISFMKKYIASKGAKEVKLVALLDKPSRRIHPVELDWRCFEVPDKFIVGFGLDYNQYYRNLPYVGVLKEEAVKKHAK